MKITSARIYSYTFYKAAVFTDHGINTFPRLTVLTPVKAKLRGPTKMDFDEQGIGKDNVDRVMMEAAGFTHIYELHTKDGVKLYVARGQVSDTEMKMSAYDSPLKVIGTGEEVLVATDLVPIEHARMMFPGYTDFATEEVEAAALLEQALKDSERVMTQDKAHGHFDSKAVKNYEKTQVLGIMLKALAEQDGEKLAELFKGKGQLEVEIDAQHAPVFKAAMEKGLFKGVQAKVTTGYAATEVSDFTDVGLVMGDAIRRMATLRVAHLAQPTYHVLDAEDEGEKELASHGYVGYWKFPLAAMGEKMAPANEQGIGPVAFSVARNLRVLVRNANSITPVGSLGLPVEVYEHLAGAKPEHVMDEAEVTAYNAVHGATARTEPAGLAN